MEVRKATLDDLDIVNYMMSEFLMTTQYGKYYNVWYGYRSLERMCTLPEQLLLVLVTEQDEPVGMLGAVSSMNPFVPVRTCSDLGWWVEPEYRGGSGAFRLLKAYEDWGKEQGCDVINLFSLNDERVDRVYARRGYVKSEHGWSKYECLSQQRQS